MPYLVGTGYWNNWNSIVREKHYLSLPKESLIDLVHNFLYKCNILIPFGVEGGERKDRLPHFYEDFKA